MKIKLGILILLFMFTPVSTVFAATHPKMWYMITSKPNDLEGMPIDHKRFFTHPNEWEQSSKYMDTYLFNKKARQSEVFEPSFLKNKVIPLFKSKNINIGFDSGFATWLSCRGAQGERNLQNDLEDIDRIVQAGGEVSYIRLQSVLSKHPPDNLIDRCNNIGYDMNQRIADVVRYFTTIKSRYPNIKIGIVDATTSHVLRYNTGTGEHFNTIFPRLQSELKKKNFELDFIILDTSTENSLGLKHPGIMEYPQILTLEQFVKNDLGIKFGILVVSEEGGYTSEQLFYDRSIQFVKEYKKKGGNPDFYFPESWYTYPWKVLPENSQAPQYSQTKVFLDVSTIVAKEKTAPSPSSTPSPTPLPGLPAQAGDINGDGAVNIFDYNLVVSNFGNPYTIFDYNAVVAQYGT